MSDVHLSTVRHFCYELRLIPAKIFKISNLELERERCQVADVPRIASQIENKTGSSTVQPRPCSCCFQSVSMLNKSHHVHVLTYVATYFQYSAVEGLTGIFCSISGGPRTYLSRPIFDRRIDLKWFWNDQNEFARSKLQKIDFWPIIRPKIGVFLTFGAINFHVLLSWFKIYTLIVLNMR